jgi:hypothetical protein
LSPDIQMQEAAPEQAIGSCGYLFHLHHNNRN